MVLHFPPDFLFSKSPHRLYTLGSLFPLTAVAVCLPYWSFRFNLFFSIQIRYLPSCSNKYKVYTISFGLFYRSIVMPAVQGRAGGGVHTYINISIKLLSLKSLIIFFTISPHFKVTLLPEETEATAPPGSQGGLVGPAYRHNTTAPPSRGFFFARFYVTILVGYCHKYKPHGD